MGLARTGTCAIAPQVLVPRGRRLYPGIRIEMLLTIGSVEVWVVPRLVVQLRGAALHDAYDDHGGEATEAVNLLIRVSNTALAAVDRPTFEMLLVQDARLATPRRWREQPRLGVAQRLGCGAVVGGGHHLAKK